jgi:hypothetical protein
MRSGTTAFTESSAVTTGDPVTFTAARVVSEVEFAAAIRNALSIIPDVGSVTGPGRSGAVAAVYASHILGVPFIPFGATTPFHLGRPLVVDTATESGKTLRKAAAKYRAFAPVVLAVYSEPPRVSFWYEARKPQRYRHERHIPIADHQSDVSSAEEGVVP